MDTVSRLRSCSLTDVRTYALAAAFITGNMALPQLVHLMPQGGLIWLPIYFFTLVGAYGFGRGVGLMTAVLSPVLNHLLFGMPGEGALAGILVKSVFLAVIASEVARRCGRVSVAAIVCVVAGYQLAGGAVESLVAWDLSAGLQDLRLGLPGIMVQVAGGYAVLRWLENRGRV